MPKAVKLWWCYFFSPFKRKIHPGTLVVQHNCEDYKSAPGLAHETSVNSKTKKVKNQFDLTRSLPKSPHTQVPYFPLQVFPLWHPVAPIGPEGVHKELEEEQYMEVTWSYNKGEGDMWRNDREHPGLEKKTRSFVKEWKRVRCQTIAFVVTARSCGISFAFETA